MIETEEAVIIIPRQEPHLQEILAKFRLREVQAKINHRFHQETEQKIPEKEFIPEEKLLREEFIQTAETGTKAAIVIDLNPLHRIINRAEVHVVLENQLTAVPAVEAAVPVQGQAAVRTELQVLREAQVHRRDAAVQVHPDLQAVHQGPAVRDPQNGDDKMKPVLNGILIGFLFLIFSACSVNRVERSYVEEDSQDDGGIIVIIQQGTTPVPVYIPVNPSREQPEVKTKERTNGVTGGSKKEIRNESTKNENVRNSSGQRNAKSRGRK